ncbi:peptidase domain-containing ABC transporter [Bacteroides pyogenes]|uniref:peptidase domain-containing ABC transporter n=1 Tax=Bacteroides pyogenes TaxID=310300 RepID=UPI002A830EC4|nr:peptidase domain-containing ABC transporter [Bacteroides pyogenes]MDY4250772.1 peptidase domain-containing ABC transporter [Bacteroides pyogenes]
MKFPFYKQYDSTDCGPACLKSIAEYYGKSIDLQYLREACYTGKDGVSLLNISNAAQNIGFKTQMVKTGIDKLKKTFALPCILHWRKNHFVVLYNISGSSKPKFHICDPAQGLVICNEDDFFKSWICEYDSSHGIALLLKKTDKFHNRKHEGCEKSTNKYSLFDYILPYRKYFYQIILGITLACLFNFILPYLAQSIVDNGIKNQDINFIIAVLIAQVMISLGQVINSLITNWILLHMTARISISLISDFLNKLTRLPIAFFDSKKTGDLLQRINDHQRIQDFLTGSMLSLIMAIFTLIIYGIVMFKYDIKILIIFIVGSILYITWIQLFMKRRKRLDYMRFQEASVNQNSLLQLINGMQEIKLNGCEKRKRWEWEKSQAKLYAISIRGLSITQIQEIGGTFIEQTKNILISFIAAKAVIDSHMTLGMMMALQYILGQLNAPIKQFITFAETGQDAKLSMDRLVEIHNKQDEEPVQKNNDIPCNPTITLKDVTFQYEGLHSEKVLNKVSLDIPYAKTLAIVGMSGSGKTTLLKLILGFYEPTDGGIFVNNRPLSEYSGKAWRMNCGVVMQEGYIFSDTIINNITICDSTPDLQKFKKAIDVANLTDFLETLPLGYDTIIGHDGHGLSAGQKQRILIARAVYKDPPILIFDEATNALDTNNEKEIMSKLTDFFQGKTVIIVAHRMSTVKNADNIVVLNKSKIIEQGPHEQLITQKGDYFNLIKNQLEISI